MSINIIFLRIHTFFRNIYTSKQKANELDEVLGADIEENSHLMNYSKPTALASQKMYEDDDLIRRVSDSESESEFECKSIDTYTNTSTINEFLDLESGIIDDSETNMDTMDEPCKCKYCYIAKKFCFIKSVTCINKKKVSNDGFIYI